MDSSAMHDADPSTGTLFIVGTPIGNTGDLSPRARDTLLSVDVIAGEEPRETRRFLRSCGLDKQIIEINEHSENEASPLVIALLRQGRNVALISDCGMPVFADPGMLLIRAAREYGVTIRVIPGPTSLTTALPYCGFDVSRFYYYGFLSAKRAERMKELAALRTFPASLVFLDAPYRLLQVLQDMNRIFGPERQCCIACDLTMPQEEIINGTIAAALRQVTQENHKREFVIIVSGVGSSARKRR